jgi:hypothetical protein
MTAHEGSSPGRTLREAFSAIRVVTYAPDAPLVVQTVAACAAEELAPGAAVVCLRTGERAPDGPRLHIEAGFPRAGGDDLRMELRMEAEGLWVLSAPRANSLYALFCLVRDEWLDGTVAGFAHVRAVRPSFPWLRNLSDFLVGSLRTSRGFSGENYVRHAARLGFTHCTVNGLAEGPPFESGPPGDVYSWFYDYSPDLDQFVDSALLRGYYPAEYLRANLAALKANAALAERYGLVPGLHINSPRSMPEAFWERYPYLRGARVDHPRESFRPRYTLALAHPTVREHYRELLRNILREVPAIGFIHLWTNDSGAGFEFVSSLYAGRNGGPYLIREWKSDADIARAAAGNVLAYLGLLRDECAAVNPEFRLICDVASFGAERRYIVSSLGSGIDAGEFGSFAGGVSRREKSILGFVGAWMHGREDPGCPCVIGVPSPVLLHERLSRALREGMPGLLASPAPASLAPYDVNSEVIRSFQFAPSRPLGEILARAAIAWAGEGGARDLVAIWLLADEAVRSVPPGVPLGTFAYPWFRLSVRPFVPDIGAIPEREREYYERYMLATFNNPARVDLNNDMLWNFLTVEEALEKMRAFDIAVFPPLEKAVAGAGDSLRRSASAEAGRVFADVRDRLRAWRSYAMTLRNMLAWTASVHGYINAVPGPAKDRFRTLCREMVQSELGNARDLLELWRESDVTFMPVAARGETLHTYGTNFGGLLEEKIRLMELHAGDEPHIDPGFMWRMQRMSH